MSHLGSIQRGLGLGLGYKLMYEDGQLAHLGYDLILFFLHLFFISFFPPFLFAFILSVINLVSVWVHSEMLIFNINNMNSYVT